MRTCRNATHAISRGGRDLRGPGCAELTVIATGCSRPLHGRRYGRQVLRAASPGLALLLLAWNAAVYTATALAAAYPGTPAPAHHLEAPTACSHPCSRLPTKHPESAALIPSCARTCSNASPGPAAPPPRPAPPGLLPPVLSSLGLFMYGADGTGPPALLPLAGQATAIACVTALAADSRRAPPAPAAAASPGRPGSSYAAPSPAAAQPYSAALTAGLAAYHVLNAAVPLSYALLASYRLDVLHGAYLAWLAVYCGAGGLLRLAPDPQLLQLLPPPEAYELPSPPQQATAASPAIQGSAGAAAAPSTLPFVAVLARPSPTPLPSSPPSHRAVRLLGSLHLLAVYAALCGTLPGLQVRTRGRAELAGSSGAAARPRPGFPRQRAEVERTTYRVVVPRSSLCYRT